MTTPRTIHPPVASHPRPGGAPHLMPLLDVALKTGWAWETIHARYKAGVLSFRVVKVRCQLYVERAEWDAYMDRILSGHQEQEQAA